MRQSLDRISTQILRFIPFLLAFLTPLFFLTTTSEFFIYNKFYLVSILATIALISWCVRSLVRGKLTFTSSPSLLPLIILVLANVISSIWLSPTKYVSLFGQTAFFTSLAIIFITTTSSQKNKIVISSVVIGLISSATILSLVTILHYFGILSKIFDSSILNSKLFNLTGGVLPAIVFTLPILVGTLAIIISSKKWVFRAALFAVSLIMIVASLINLTLILPSNGQQIIFLLPYNISWQIAVDTLKHWQTALLGSGPETYLTSFTRFRPTLLNYNEALWGLRFPESGSFILTLVTTTGLIGAFFFVLVFLKPLFVALKHKNAAKENPSFIFLSIVLAFSFLSFVLLPSGVVSIVLGIVSLIALTIDFKINGYKTSDITLSIHAKSEHEGLYRDISESEKVTPAALVLPWLLTILSAFLIAVYWFYAIPAYSASVSVKQAADLAQTNPLGAYLKEVNASQIDPRNSAYPLVLSQFFKQASLTLLNKKDIKDEEKKTATDYMQRSIDYGKQVALIDSYNPASWENLADIYSSFIGVADGAQNFAVSHLVQAIALDPTNPKLRLKLGILFFNLGDSEQAIKLVSQAIEAKQNWDTPYYNLATIYQYKKDYQRALQYMQEGLNYTKTGTDDYSKVQEQIKRLEKLVPSSTQNASSSAQAK